MRPKGLREIRTTQGLAGKSRTSSREQAVAELARLEHERSRLQRELEVWRQNGLRVEGQLQRVETRLKELQALTAEEAAPKSPATRSGTATRQSNHDDERESGWSSLSLEY